MTDMEMEKVIKGLELCLTPTESSEYDDMEVCHAECPYFRAYNMGDCVRALAKDALALLKAQEPNEDWISRKRLKDEIQYYIDEAGWGDEANKVLGWCMEFIDNQMAVKWE